jgi:hypothetical protein
MKVANLGAPVLSMTGSPANVDDGQLHAEIMQAFDIINAAFERRDTATIEAMTTTDHVAITSFFDGAVAWQEQKAGVADLDIKQRPVGDIVVSSLSADVALQSHVAKRKGTMRGKPIAPVVAVSIIWQRVDGKWRERQYQETAISSAG